MHAGHAQIVSAKMAKCKNEWECRDRMPHAKNGGNKEIPLAFGLCLCTFDFLAVNCTWAAEDLITAQVYKT